MRDKKANNLLLLKSLLVDERYSKLLNCQVNIIYFFKNHEIPITYFENEKHIPWKQLNYDFITKPIFCDFFNINKNPLEMEF